MFFAKGLKFWNRQNGSMHGNACKIQFNSQSDIFVKYPTSGYNQHTNSSKCARFQFALLLHLIWHCIPALVTPAAVGTSLIPELRTRTCWMAPWWAGPEMTTATTTTAMISPKTRSLVITMAGSSLHLQVEIILLLCHFVALFWLLKARTARCNQN